MKWTHFRAFEDCQSFIKIPKGLKSAYYCTTTDETWGMPTYVRIMIRNKDKNLFRPKMIVFYHVDDQAMMKLLMKSTPQKKCKWHIKKCKWHIKKCKWHIKKCKWHIKVFAFPLLSAPTGACYIWEDPLLKTSQGL